MWQAGINWEIQLEGLCMEQSIGTGRAWTPQHCCMGVAVGWQQAVVIHCGGCPSAGRPLLEGPGGWLVVLKACRGHKTPPEVQSGLRHAEMWHLEGGHWIHTLYQLSKLIFKEKEGILVKQRTFRYCQEIVWILHWAFLKTPIFYLFGNTFKLTFFLVVLPGKSNAWICYSVTSREVLLPYLTMIW